VMSPGTISSPANISSIMIYGIDPVREKPLSKMDEAITRGSYVQDAGDIMIGAELAEKLHVKTGSRVVITVSKADSSELSQHMLRVKGIYRMHIDQLDASAAFLTLEQAQELLGLGEGIHEIAVSFTQFNYALEHKKEFSGRYSKYGNIAETWPLLIPQLKYIIDMNDMMMGVMVVLVFAVIIFGIINTLFMSLYERTFEFGVLRAVGTRPGGLRKLIVFEAGSLAVYAVLMGIALGTGFNMVGSVVGMDLTGVELAGATFTSRVYTSFTVRQYTLHPLLIFGFTVLVSLYPASHAARMSVTDALRKTL
ncbi:MAG: ABC transporter permease, partial [Spirochaetota bacterium]